MKRLLLIVVVGTSLATPIQDDFRERLVEFHTFYDIFVRKFIGCPKITAFKQDGYEMVECKPIMGVFDRAAFAKARTAAKKLFDLEERK